MITIRRFFEADVPEVPSAPSIASLMASKGTKVEADSQVEVPAISIKKETKEQTDTPAVKADPVETTNSTSPVETAKPETPTPPKESKPEAKTPQTEERPKAAQQWQEVLKQQPPDTVLKELGYDAEVVKLAKELGANPQMKGFYEHWKNKGDVKDYFKALTTDFKAMKPEEVMRHQLREANPDLDEKQLGILFKKKITERYKQDAELYSAEEIEEGYVEMLADAKPIRQQLQQEQEKFFIPPPPEKEPQVDVLAEQQKREADQKLEIQKLIYADPVYRDVLASGKLKFGEGDEAYSLPMKDPESVLDVLWDTQKLTSKLFDENGLPNMRLQLRLAALLDDDEKLFKAIAKHNKSIGGKSALEPVENPSQPGISVSPAQASYKSAAEAMAKAGRKVSASD